MARKRQRASGGAQSEREIAEQLDALYAELPKLACKGKCWKCCGPVLMSPGERERIRREGGVEVPTVPEMRREHRTMCPALKNHRCTVYTARPLVCRLWGIEETMRCPYGCVPEGGWMSEREAVGFWLRVYTIAGWPMEKEERLTPKQVAERLRRYQEGVARDPEGMARVQPEAEPPRGLRRWRRSR